MRHLSCLGLLLLISTCGSGDDRPSVLLIVMDTVRADRCSLNGEPRATTPGLERLAAEGVVFRDAWSPAGWTPPAHASLFTGLLPDHHGVLIGNRLYLDEDMVTLAELLGEAGYRTTCLTNNIQIAPEFGMTQGFEKTVSLDDRPDAVYPTCGWAHAEALEVAIAARDADVPFFIFVNDMEAHLPYTPPEAFQDRFLSGEFELWEQIRAREFDGDAALDHAVGRKRVPQRMAGLLDDLYRAEIACLDEHIDKLMRDLEREGILDDTVVVITSDHGENLGDHDLFGHRVSLHRSIRHVPLPCGSRISSRRSSSCAAWPRRPGSTAPHFSATSPGASPGAPTDAPGGTSRSRRFPRTWRSISTASPSPSAPSTTGGTT